MDCCKVSKRVCSRSVDGVFGEKTEVVLVVELKMGTLRSESAGGVDEHARIVACARLQEFR